MGAKASTQGEVEPGARQRARRWSGRGAHLAVVVFVELPVHGVDLGLGGDVGAVHEGDDGVGGDAVWVVCAQFLAVAVGAGFGGAVADDGAGSGGQGAAGPGVGEHDQSPFDEEAHGGSFRGGLLNEPLVGGFVLWWGLASTGLTFPAPARVLLGVLVLARAQRGRCSWVSVCAGTLAVVVPVSRVC